MIPALVVVAYPHALLRPSSLPVVWSYEACCLLYLDRLSCCYDIETHDAYGGVVGTR